MVWYAMLCMCIYIYIYICHIIVAVCIHCVYCNRTQHIGVHSLCVMCADCVHYVSVVLCCFVLVRLPDLAGQIARVEEGGHAEGAIGCGQCDRAAGARGALLN